MSASQPPPIVDADGHVVEPEAVWQEHLEPRFRPFVPRPVPDGDGSGFHFRAGEVEPGLDAVLEACPDCVLFASDDPHGDGVFPGATAELLETDTLDAEQRARVLHRNAERCHALPPEG